MMSKEDYTKEQRKWRVTETVVDNHGQPSEHSGDDAEIIRVHSQEIKNLRSILLLTRQNNHRESVLRDFFLFSS